MGRRLSRWRLDIGPGEETDLAKMVIAKAEEATGRRATPQHRAWLRRNVSGMAERVLAERPPGVRLDRPVSVKSVESLIRGAIRGHDANLNRRLGNRDFRRIGFVVQSRRGRGGDGKISLPRTLRRLGLRDVLAWVKSRATPENEAAWLYRVRRRNTEREAPARATVRRRN